MNYDMKRSGERIRQLRIQNGLTQEKTASVLISIKATMGVLRQAKEDAP